MFQFTNKQLQTYSKIFIAFCGLLFLCFFSVYIVVILIFLVACVHYCKDWSELTTFHAQVLQAILADCMIWLESTMSSLFKSFQRPLPNTRESGENESIKFNSGNSQYSPRQNSLSQSSIGNNQVSSYLTGAEYATTRSPNFTRFSSASPSNRNALDVCNRSDIISRNVCNDEMGYTYKSSPWPKHNTSSSPVAEKHKVKPVQNVGGPLLACSHNTNKSTNLRLYADACSPGLAGRSVQYHQEGAENRQPWAITHQAKYKSVGQFPIVKLKSSNQVPKLNLSVSPKAPRTPSLSGGGPTPGLLQSSPIAVNSPGKNIHHMDATVEPHDISVRAVIEALKEISRKRIRSQCLSSSDLEDDNAKRQKRGIIEEAGKINRNVTRQQLTPTNNGLLQGKRGRESPPHQDSSSECSLPDLNNTNSGQSRSKKLCSNEILSSLSSSRCLLLLAAKNKRKFAISPESSPRCGTPVPDQLGKHFKASYHELSKEENSLDVVDTRQSRIEDAILEINERKMTSSTQDDSIEKANNSDSPICEGSQLKASQKQLNKDSIDSVAPSCPQRKIVEAEDLEEQRKKDRSALVGLLTVLSRGESPFRDEGVKPESVRQPELTTVTTVVSSSATPTTTPKSQKHVSFAENLISGPTASPAVSALHKADTVPIDAVNTNLNSSYTFGSFASTTDSPSTSLAQPSISTGSAESPAIAPLPSSFGSFQKPVASPNETTFSTFTPNKSALLTTSTPTLLTPSTSTLLTPSTSTLVTPSTSTLVTPSTSTLVTPSTSTQNTVLSDGKCSNVSHIEPVTSTFNSAIQTSSSLFTNQPLKSSVVVSSSNQSFSFGTGGNIFSASVSKTTIPSGTLTSSSNISDSSKFGGLSTLPTSSVLTSQPLPSFTSSQPLPVTATVTENFNNTNSTINSTENSFMLPSSTSLTQTSQKPEVPNIFSVQSNVPQFGTGQIGNIVSESNSSATVGGFNFTSRTPESTPAPIQFGSGLKTDNSTDKESFKFSAKPFQFAAAQSKPTGFAFCPTSNATNQMKMENSSILSTSNTIQPSVFSKTTTASSTTQNSSFSLPSSFSSTPFSSSKSIFGTSDPLKTTPSNIFGSVAQNNQNLFSTSSNATSRDSKLPAFGSVPSEPPKPHGISELKSAPFTFSSAAAPASTTAPFTFGSATKVTTTAPFTFAAASAPTSTAAPFQFGSSNSSKSEAVTFGTTSVASPTQFVFGSSGSQPGAAHLSTNKTPFQFGATSTTQSTGGFNFTSGSASGTPVINFSSGSSSTPGLFTTPGVPTQAFGSPGPSMFSIGSASGSASGSSAAKSRSSKTKKQR